MDFFDVLYKELDYKDGALFNTIDAPNESINKQDWLDKGEWLTSAKNAGAEKVFFIENNPLIIFSRCDDNLLSKVKAFNNAWCLARPRFLFLSVPGELTVYDLAKEPIVEKDKNNWGKLTPLETLTHIEKVAVQLHKYNKNNLESGLLFEEKQFGDINNRADKALIRDLKIVRSELVAKGLNGNKLKFTHALIGRSIFIRYLEDRGILTEDYFINIARQKAGWKDILCNPLNRTGLDFTDHLNFYPRILSDKNFTYALFNKLAKDFNGDMFPDIEEEETIVKQTHLDCIQDLLYGDVGIQKKLFFYSYRFNIIPLDLISSIYEEFYHIPASKKIKRSKARQDGAFYTPTVLAEFMLSRILTTKVLKKKPRIMDPACGSGVFLVEAFRRIIRYEWMNKKQPLSFNEIKSILKDQISGIEVNTEAANITAFSLYVSMLNYLSPPAIVQQIKMGNKLPNIIASHNNSINDYHSILPLNAFDLISIESNEKWKEKFGHECADIVVGNPPWGSTSTKAAREERDRERIVIDWCKKKELPIGDRERSQAFIWRAMDLLKKDGAAGMLVSAGVLFKHGSLSRSFRTQWLRNACIEEVFNFIHVRKIFFKEAISPFLGIFFNKSSPNDVPIFYWSAKQTKLINKTQAILFSKHDLRILHDQDATKSHTWKINFWGSKADYDFIQLLSNKESLASYVNRIESGQGLVPSPAKYSTKKIAKYKLLPASVFSRYDGFPSSSFEEVNKLVYRLGNEKVYFGKRLLVQRGIDESCEEAKGLIIARYVTKPFCFTNSINGIKLKKPEDWKYKTILGILWSSFARYYFFLTSSNWGLWHHEIHLDDELLQLPITLVKNNRATAKIIKIVNKLCLYHPKKNNLFNPDGISDNDIYRQRQEWESELDEAVFELYNLNEEQKDLIRDMCEVTIPFFYKPFDSIGISKSVLKEDYSWIEKYIKVFCRRWNAYLNNEEEMHAEVHLSIDNNIVAIEFYPADKNDFWNIKPQNDSWKYILEKMGGYLQTPMGSERFVLDGVVHSISENGIIIIKRNQKIYWTRSLAREDADSTICKRMTDTMPRMGVKL